MMESISTFFEMGGYAAFIWPCYGITAIFMVGILASSIRSRNKNHAILSKLENKE